MSDYEEETVVVPPDDAKPVNTPLENAVEEAKSKLWTDDDILQHVLAIVTRKLESSRNDNFTVELSYSELRLISEAINLAITRTNYGNQLVESFQHRANAVKELSSRIAEIVDIKLK